MSPDEIPWAVAGFGGALSWVAWIVLEFRASKRYWAERDANDPVVVTGSGVRRDHRMYACKSVGGVR